MIRKTLALVFLLLGCKDGEMGPPSDYLFSQPAVLDIALQDGSHMPGHSPAQLHLNSKNIPVRFRLVLGAEDAQEKRSWSVDAVLTDDQVLSGSFSLEAVPPQAAGPATWPAPGQAVVGIVTWTQEADETHPLRQGYTEDMARAGRVTGKIEGDHISGEAVVDPGHLSARFSGKISKFCNVGLEELPESSRPVHPFVISPAFADDLNWESDFCRKFKEVGK